LCTVHQGDVQQLVNGWVEKLAPKTVDRTHGTLRAAFAYAVSAGLIGRSPCHDVSLPKAVKRKRRVVAPRRRSEAGRCDGPSVHANGLGRSATRAEVG
jgi:site-specific recombinase XerD